MTQVIHAVFEDGLLKPLEDLDLPEKQQVRLIIEPVQQDSRKAEDANDDDPLDGLRVATGIPDLAEHFDDYRLGRRSP